MTDHTIDDTAAYLTAQDTESGTLTTPDGDELPIETTVPTLDELDALDEQLADDEEAAIRAAVGEYLVEPDVPAEDMPFNKLSQLWAAMQRVWSGVDEIETAMGEMPLQNQGNR